MDLAVCSVCGGPLSVEAVDVETIKREFQAQHEFVHARLNHRPDPAELKDLVDFMHGAPAPLLECRSCGLMVRAEEEMRAADSYGEDKNDPDVMAQVYPRYLRAFMKKERAYRPLLRPGAEVLEIGSHLGAFLEAAHEWNWNALGVDIGDDTTEFVRRRGLPVHKAAIEEAGLPDSSFDGVFVWNCFEQLPDPLDVLGRLRRLLKPHGLLVLRVPNALYYKLLRQDTRWRRSLAYNNLLGFPYLYGHTADTLNRLVARAGFSYVEGFNSELVTTPFADVPSRLRREQERISREVARWSSRTTRERRTLTGPWIEVVYRKASQILSPQAPDSALFLPRAA